MTTAPLDLAVPCPDDSDTAPPVVAVVTPAVNVTCPPSRTAPPVDAPEPAARVTPPPSAFALLEDSGSDRRQ